MAEQFNSYFDEKIERHMSLDIDNPDTYPAFEKLGKALSSQARLEILKLLGKRSMNIVEIAETVNIPISSAAFHVNSLELAGLIVTETQPGIRGSKRVCSASVEDVTLLLNKSTQQDTDTKLSVEMPIGQFFNCNIRPTCGLANEEGYIEVCDNPRAFFSPSRATAQLLWFQQGFIEYRFPNHLFEGRKPSDISFSLEICSEAPGYRNNWPSDITFSINGQEITTYTSPGDFGGRRGKLTPDWWTDGNTQFGLLKTITVNRQGGFLDETLCNENISIDALDVTSAPFITFAIEIKDDAHYIGGLNLFGRNFGNYPQDIVMHVEFEKQKS